MRRRGHEIQRHLELKGLGAEELRKMGCIRIFFEELNIDVVGVQIVNGKKVWTAVEAQLSVKHSVENALKDLQRGADYVVFVFDSEKVMRATKARLTRELHLFMHKMIFVVLKG